MSVRGDATMRVNGQLPAVQQVTVQADGKLGGDGVIGGSVIVANDGILSPGAGRTFDDRIGSLTTGVIAAAFVLVYSRLFILLL